MLDVAKFHLTLLQEPDPVYSPSVVVRQVKKSDRINSDRQSGLDQLGSNKKKKKNEIGLGSTWSNQKN